MSIPTPDSNPVPSLSSMKHVHVTVALTSVYMRIEVDIHGPSNLVDLTLAGVKTAATRWPAQVTVQEL